MRRSVIALAVVLAIPAVVSAHRLDEYLQASRVTLDHDRITLEIDLTPGISVAPAAVSLLDRDGEGTISPDEAALYGRRVLADLAVSLDSRPVVLNLTRIEVPSTADMHDGLATIRLTAVGQVPSLIGGRHQLLLRNTHAPKEMVTSVYLANAMMPSDEGVTVVKQRRDPRQQELRVDYEVALGWPGQFLWLAFGITGLAVLAALRWKRSLFGGADGKTARVSFL